VESYRKNHVRKLASEILYDLCKVKLKKGKSKTGTCFGGAPQSSNSLNGKKAQALEQHGRIFNTCPFSSSLADSIDNQC